MLVIAIGAFVHVTAGHLLLALAAVLTLIVLAIAGLCLIAIGTFVNATVGLLAGMVATIVAIVTVAMGWRPK